MSSPKVHEVFVDGVPTCTYHPRRGSTVADLSLVEQGRQSVGALVGPAQSGKTTLLHRALDRAVVIDGAQLIGPDALRDRLASMLDVPADERSRFEHTEASGSSGTTGFSAQLVSHERGRQDGLNTARAREWGSSRQVEDRVLAKLVRERTLVAVDDFHAVDEPVRRALVPRFRTLVDRSVPVVLATLDRGALDAFRCDPQMADRVELVAIPPWESDELRAVAVRGFEALNLDVPETTLKELVERTEGSPRRLHRLCRALCRAAGVEARVGRVTRLPDPDWDAVVDDVDRRRLTAPGPAGTPGTVPVTTGLGDPAGPAAGVEVGATRPPGPTGPVDAAGPGGVVDEATVLIVDDEDALVMRQQLADHRCLVATTKEEAFAHIRHPGLRIDAALVDICIHDPTGDSGREVLDELDRVLPRVPRTVVSYDPKIHGDADRFRERYGVHKILFKSAPGRAVEDLRTTVAAMLSPAPDETAAMVRHQIEALARQVERSLRAERGRMLGRVRFDPADGEAGARLQELDDHLTWLDQRRRALLGLVDEAAGEGDDPWSHLGTFTEQLDRRGLPR